MTMTPRLMRRLAAPLLAALAALALSAPAQAQWKWRDGNGQIHISDTPPPREIPDKNVLQRPEVVVRQPVAAAAPPAPASAASAVAIAKPAVDPKLEEKKRLADQQQAARDKAEEQKAAAVRQDNCLRARQQLATLDSGMRMARVNANGEREVLTDAQRAQEAQRARTIMASECK